MQVLAFRMPIEAQELDLALKSFFVIERVQLVGIIGLSPARNDSLHVM